MTIVIEITQVIEAIPGSVVPLAMFIGKDSNHIIILSNHIIVRDSNHISFLSDLGKP